MPIDDASTLPFVACSARKRKLRHWLRARWRLLRLRPRRHPYFDEAERIAYARRIAELRAEAACTAPRRF